MGKSYSADLRDRISGHVLTGHSRRDAARRFGVSVSCAIKLGISRNLSTWAPPKTLAKLSII